MNRDRSAALPGLYHRLVVAAGADEEASALAIEHLEWVLGGPRRAVNAGSLGPRGLWPWSAAGLDRWVSGQIRGGRLGPPSRLQEAPELAQDFSREDVGWLLLQLAPSAFVDGAWLAGAARVHAFHTDTAALLLRIYRDELGAGVPFQHHGNVLRRALAAEGIFLPACDTEAFVRVPQLSPEAFRLPVLWLAMARGGIDYLPELLGLNLAIEISGLEGSYERATQLLRHHGVDPYFFELHNTIDNASSGHTAWSVQAIGLHMEDLALGGGEEAQERSWLRIWQGFAAYDEASTPLVRRIALRLGPRVGLRWLRRRAVSLQGSLQASLRASSGEER